MVVDGLKRFVSRVRRQSNRATAIGPVEVSSGHANQIEDHSDEVDPPGVHAVLADPIAPLPAEIGSTAVDSIKIDPVAGNPSEAFPLRPELPLPAGYDENALYDFLSAVRVANAPEADMLSYCRTDFRRFVYTWSLVSGAAGRALELGANPYFTTMLLQSFTRLKLTLANFFGDTWPAQGQQDVAHQDPGTGEITSTTLLFDHFNIENDRFPYPDDAFDFVFFCEIIEHLLMDPLRVLREIRRVLRPGGQLILTTPNVNRLENVARMIAGANIYDPYSGYGPYGRHNREYNKHELYLLLRYAGFEMDIMFSADVHENLAYSYAPDQKLNELVRFREHDLGQYLFVRVRKAATAQERKPDFLYRSYPSDELEMWQ